jgi:hypothetical protein
MHQKSSPVRPRSEKGVRMGNINDLVDEARVFIVLYKLANLGTYLYSYI